MKRLAALLFFFLLLAHPALAQDPAPYRYRGNGHAYFATGACQHGYLHLGAGGGGEALVWRGVALGGEAGFMVFNDNRSQPIGLFATTAGYHFGNRSRLTGASPFVNVAWVGVGTGGSEWGTTAYGGIGGGVNYWFKPKLGMRVEGRLHALGAGEALFIFRLGVAFR